MQDKTKDLVNEYTSLSLAIGKLLDRQEKNWGCFQVQKEENFYTLYIPNLPSFKLYQNPKSLIYRGYWRRNNELPNPTDTKSFPPDLWIKKKQKKVDINPNKESKKSDSIKKVEKEKKFIYQLNHSSEKKKSRGLSEIIQKKQRIYEINYRYNPVAEVRIMNQLMADFIKDKIISSIISVPEEEIFPLVLVANPQ